MFLKSMYCFPQEPIPETTLTTTKPPNKPSEQKLTRKKRNEALTQKQNVTSENVKKNLNPNKYVS